MTAVDGPRPQAGVQSSFFFGFVFFILETQRTPSVRGEWPSDKALRSLAPFAVPITRGKPQFFRIPDECRTWNHSRCPSRLLSIFPYLVSSVKALLAPIWPFARMWAHFRRSYSQQDQLSLFCSSGKCQLTVLEPTREPDRECM